MSNLSVQHKKAILCNGLQPQKNTLREFNQLILSDTFSINHSCISLSIQATALPPNDTVLGKRPSAM